MEEEDSKFYEFGFDNDLLTAYVWRNSVVNDGIVWQPCVWADLTCPQLFKCLPPLTFGGYVWQNWDLTGRRSDEGLPRAMNETDYNIHLGATVWESEDGEYGVWLEFGHDWFTYRNKPGYGDDWPASYELYLKAEFTNPYVSVYGQYSQAYKPVCACHFEVGLKKDVNIGEALESESSFLKALTFGADWNMNFGSGKYLTEYLYGVGSGAYLYDEDADEFYFEDDYLSNGIGGTTIKFNLAWEVCEHFTLGVVAAYTGILSNEICESMSDAGYGTIHKSLAWGGLQAKVSF